MMIWNNNTCGTIQDPHPRKPETPKPPEHPSPLSLRTSLRLAECLKDQIVAVPFVAKRRRFERVPLMQVFYLRIFKADALPDLSPVECLVNPG